MEISIFYHGETIGTAQFSLEGLYWSISCRLSKKDMGLVRLYAIKGLQSIYLGIPDASGVLNTKLSASHLPENAERLVAAKEPRGQWSPWTGELDGVTVPIAMVCNGESSRIAFPTESAIAFPEWIERMEPLQIYNENWLCINLQPDGQLPKIENEVLHEDETADGFNLNDFMLDNDAPDDSSCSEATDDGQEGDEADCFDL